MKKKNALIAALVLALAGMAFSGYLTYREVTAPASFTCANEDIAGIPPCAIGLVVYLLIVWLAFSGKASSLLKAIGVIGVLFSGLLTVEGVFNLGINCTTLLIPSVPVPICGYGLAMYTIIAILAALGMRAKKSKK